MASIGTLRVQYNYVNACTVCMHILYLDLNECHSGSHDCSVHAHCTNEHGTHTCSCYRGYSGNGTLCSGELCLYMYFILYNEFESV